MSVLFAATHPERTRALVLYGSFATWRKTSEHPWGLTPENVEGMLAMVDQHWGEGVSLGFGAPGVGASS